MDLGKEETSADKTRSAGMEADESETLAVSEPSEASKVKQNEHSVLETEDLTDNDTKKDPVKELLDRSDDSFDQELLRIVETVEQEERDHILVRTDDSSKQSIESEENKIVGEQQNSQGFDQIEKNEEKVIDTVKEQIVEPGTEYEGSDHEPIAQSSEVAVLAAKPAPSADQADEITNHEDIIVNSGENLVGTNKLDADDDKMDVSDNFEDGGRFQAGPSSDKDLEEPLAGTSGKTTEAALNGSNLAGKQSQVLKNLQLQF